MIGMKKSPGILMLAAAIALVAALALVWAQSRPAVDRGFVALEIRFMDGHPGAIYGIFTGFQKTVEPESFDFRSDAWKISGPMMLNPGNGRPAGWSGEIAGRPILLGMFAGPQSGKVRLQINGRELEINLHRAQKEAVMFDLTPFRTFPDRGRYRLALGLGSGLVIFLLLLGLLPARLNWPRSTGGWLDWGYCGGFAAVLGLPLLAALLLPPEWRGQSTEESEMRRLNRLTWTELTRMPSVVTVWFDDYLPFRRLMIGLLADGKYRLFHETIDSRQVIAGKNGWLYLGNTYHNLTVPGSAAEMTALEDSLLEVRKQLTAVHCRFYVLIVPDKHLVYPEYLPSWLARLTPPQSAATVADDLQRLGIKVFRAAPWLLEAKQKWGELLFQKTDSHWSALGAYCAYAELMNLIRADWPGVKTISLAGTKLIPPRGVYNLQQMAGLRLNLHDFAAVTPALEGNPLTVVDLGTLQTVSASSDFRVRYNKNLLVKNPAAPSPLRVLVLKDSFSEALSPWLNHSFQEVAYVNFILTSRSHFASLVAEFKPNLVIFETVEQNLFQVAWRRWAGTAASR